MSGLLVYHWTPSWNRDLVSNEGLRPGCPSTDGLWCPPYVCFSDSPSLAWALSGGTARGLDHAEWDLWVAWEDALPGHEELYFDPGDEGERERPPRVKERRVYEPVPADDLWYVGTRTQEHRR